MTVGGLINLRMVMHAQTEAGEPHVSLATRCEGDAVDAVADAPCIATQERGEAVREAEGRGGGSDRLQADASATTRSTRSTTERPRSVDGSTDEQPAVS
mmetsp:Transcript_176494/g.565864  ORF Transcript_176494/g.565864 Transcript_176494/m.565864 type:complete len:99 (+) Transcript_176494:630-926(+)